MSQTIKKKKKFIIYFKISLEIGIYVENWLCELLVHCPCYKQAVNHNTNKLVECVGLHIFRTNVLQLAQF